METIARHLQPATKANLIARFGAANLVAKTDGRMELRGGSRSDQIEAREWISLFMHYAVPRVAPGN